MSRVKGSNMAHWRAWIQRDYGSAEWERVLAALSSEDQLELRSVIAVGWYPLSLQHRFLQAIVEVLDEANVLERLTAYEVERDYTVIHRLLFRLLTPAILLKQGAKFWHRFYDTGTWKIDAGRGYAHAELRGFDGVPIFAPYLRYCLWHAWALAGAKNRKVTVERRDDGVFVIEGSWD